MRRRSRDSKVEDGLLPNMGDLSLLLSSEYAAFQLLKCANAIPDNAAVVDVGNGIGGGGGVNVVAGSGDGVGGGGGDACNNSVASR